MSDEWLDKFGIACGWTQPNSLMSGGDRRLVMLIDEFNVAPDIDKPAPEINLAIQDILGLPILGPVLLFVTKPYHIYSSKEITQNLNLTLEECRSEMPFLLSCFIPMDTEHEEQLYYWLMPGLKSEVRTDPEKMERLKNVASKLGVLDSKLFSSIS